MDSKKYFDSNYGKNHIKSVVQMNDLESLHGLINEFSENVMYSVVDRFIDKLANKYEIPKSSIYMKQGFNCLRFYSDQLYDGSSSEQLLEVVSNEKDRSR